MDSQNSKSVSRSELGAEFIMRYLCAAKFEDVLTEWSKREKKEVCELLASRGSFILRLPVDTQWFKVELTGQDLPLLRLIRDTSWDDISAFTGDMEIAANNFRIFSKVHQKLPHEVLPDGRTRQEYFDTLVEALLKFRQNAGDPNHNLTLILITSSRTKPFTIMEGNHTAMALYFRYFVDHKELTCPCVCAFAGESPRIFEYPWFRVT